MNLRSTGYRLSLSLSARYLVYGCLLAAKSVAGFPASHTTHTRWPWLGDKPVGEDGFYMLTVADNLVRTHHLVYNYGLPATGIQPLSTFVFAGIAFVTDHLGGDRWTLIRAVLLFGIVLFLVFAWQIAFLAAGLAPPDTRTSVFVIAFVLVLFDFTAFRLFTYGLETGMYLIAIACCLRLWLRLCLGTAATPRAGWRDMLLLGLAMGVAGLARIDFGLFVVFLLGWLLLKRVASLLQVLACGLVALVVVSPWFLFVHSVGTGWLPSSGKAESRLFSTAHDLGRIPAAALGLLSHICTWSYGDAGTRTTTLLACVSFALLLWLAWQARGSAAAFDGLRGRGIFTAWLPAIAALMLVYIVFFWSTQFYARYFSPLLVLSVPCLAILFATQRVFASRPLLLVVPLVCLFCVLDDASLHGGHVVLDHLISAGYIHETFPRARVGAFQSGDLGYFNPNVENLDGKLNPKALVAAQTHALDAFIDSERIDVLVDWPGYLKQLPPEYLAREWQPCPRAMPVPDSICYVRRTPFAAASAK